MSAAHISVPQAVDRKLHAVRGRRQLLALLAGTAQAAAVFCGLLLAALFVDWLVTPFEPALRVALTAGVIVAGAAAWLVWGLKPWLFQPSLPKVAGLVDAAVPRLEERWTTIADLARNSDPPEIRGSSELIGQVAREAEHLHNLVEPQQIVSSRQVRTNTLRLGGLVALFAVVWLIDREQVSVLWQRFWSPTSEISLTSVTSSTADATVPRHEPLTILAQLQQRIRKSATISIRDEAGHVTRHAMSPIPDSQGEFAFAVESVAAPLAYRIRSGDGQTPWHRVEVADRPRLTNVEFRIAAPEYSKLPAIEQQGLPRRTRALEGSTLDIVFTSSEPLRDFNLVLADGSTLAVSPSSDKTYRFQQTLTEDFSFSPRLVSRHGLTNDQPPSCHVVIYRDQFPTVAMVSPNEDIVVRPDDSVKVEFTAKDDFGIAKAELVITDPNRPDAEPLQVIEIPLGEQQNQTEVEASLELDLQDLKPEQGTNLSYAIRVFDTKDSTGESRQSAANSHAAQQANATKAEDQQPAEPQVAQNDAAQNQNDQEQKPAEASNGDKNDQQSQSSSASNSNSAKPSQMAKADDEQQPQGKMEGAPRPGDNMARRELNLGQCTSCKPMNLKIDEWAGSFAGQMREKLEIAIEEFLERMDAALENAERENRAVFEQYVKDSAWDEPQVVGVRKTAGHLTAASQVAVDLAAKSAGTPYAFMALQLEEIDERHIGPAQGKLQGLPQQENDARKGSLESSLFHIRRARELLAKLTRTYQGVKINHQIAEAMTHVKQMHQVFIEDAFKLLGESRPVLNPKQRKFLELELDEEFREKLKALLEKKRDVQAELAKILAEDPDLLRRFMSRARVDADSLRDQMTLQARRQLELRDETQAALLDDADANAAAAASRKLRHAQEAEEIAQAAALMAENFETWLPAGLALEDSAVEPVQRLMQELASAASHLGTSGAGAESGPDQAQRAYDLLNALQEELPKLAEARESHAKLTAHVTNRLVETGKLTTLVSGWLHKSQAFAKGDEHRIALVDQSQLTNSTADLTNKLANFRSWMSGLTVEIADLAKGLTATLEDELLVQQVTAEDLLEANEVAKAHEQQALAVESFAKAEAQFDKLLEAIIAHLDAQPVNTKPSLDGVDAPSIEELLALLENEKLVAEGLGIPCCRPSNLSIVQDWMSPGKNGGMGGAMASGALLQTQFSQQRANRLQRTADNRKRKLLAEAANAAGKNGTGVRRVNPRWNTLQSKLDDGLKQVRGQSPPPKYRSAIERYFEVIAGVPDAEEK